MYGYYPDEAKRLLAEAGYPDGFKTSVVCTSASVDLLSIVKDNWAKVGVDLTFDVKETAAYRSLSVKKEYDLLMGSAQSSNPEMMSRDRVGNVDNYSMIADPLLEEAYAAVTANFFEPAKKAEIYREIGPHMLEQAYYLVLPGGVSYTFWWPWVKNYSGEQYIGTWAKMFNFPQYIWIDQDLKEEMTGRR
jgi:peptide/nickel transport system substrate-binding protein